MNDALGIIKQAMLRRKVMASVKYTKGSIRIIKFFYELGYLYRYNIVNTQIQIWIRYYENQSILSDIRIMSRSTHRRSVSIWELKKAVHHNRILILSTKYGIMLGTTALKLRIGGDLLCELK